MMNEYVNDTMWHGKPMVEQCETHDFFERDKVYREQRKDKPHLADALKGQFKVKAVYTHDSTRVLYAHGLYRSAADRPWNPYPINLTMSNWTDGWDEIEEDRQ